MVGVAAGRDAEVAVSYAAREAAARGTSLELVHVLRPGTPRPAGTLEEAEVGVLHRARQVAAAEAPLVPVTSTLLGGPPAESLVAHAESAGLLVVGASATAPTDRWRPESLSTVVAAGAGCPVAVVPPDAGHTVIRRVVVGLRWPPHEDEALLEEGFAAAERWHCDLEVVHAGRAQGSRRDPPTPRGHDPGWVPGLTALVEEHLVVPRRRHPEVHVRVDVVRSSPAEALMDSVGPGTVLMVSRTSDGTPGPALGPTSRGVLHLARCAVELVPVRRMHGPR